MLIRELVVCCAFAALAGCVSPVNVQLIAPEQQNIKKPEIGRVMAREVGDTLIDQSSLRVLRGIEFADNLEFLSKRNSGSKNVRVRIAPGAHFVKDRKINGKPAFCGPAVWDTTLFQQGAFQPIRICVIERTGSLYDQWGEPLVFTGGGAPVFRPRDIVHPTPGHLRRNLLYFGRVGDRLTLSFREFVDNLARPALTQEVIFDLSGERQIGFRGARFEVLEETNTAIRYRVLKRFGDTQ